MIRGKRKEVGAYNDWCEVPIEGIIEEVTKPLTDYEIVDVVDIRIKTETDEIVCWKNPKYKKSEE